MKYDTKRCVCAFLRAADKRRNLAVRFELPKSLWLRKGQDQKMEHSLAVGDTQGAVGESDAHEVVRLERQALVRWLAGDPSGFLEISADDVVYFDPFTERRLDGLVELTAYYEAIRGKVHADRFELLNPKVQVIGSAAILTFNFISYGGGENAMRWNCTEVYRYAADRWKIIQTHWSFTKVT